MRTALMNGADLEIVHLEDLMIRAFLNFDSFIFPRIASVIYWIGMVLIVMITFGSAIGALFMGGQEAQLGLGGGILGFVAAMLGGGIGIIVWRVVVEFWLVVFSIRETLRDIRDQGVGMSSR